MHSKTEGNGEAAGRAAERWGVATRYVDWRGEERLVADDVVRRVVDVLSAAGSAEGRPIPAVTSRFEGEPAHVSVDPPGPGARLEILLEHGGRRVLADDIDGPCAVTVPEDLPVGYHRLLLSAAGPTVAGTLIVAPQRCYQPEPLAHDRRVWGAAVQLYALRSAEDWGIGDFGELAAFVRRAAERGMDAVGLNPLHALFRDDPERCSPYGPASREFLNPLYIDVSAVPDMAECEVVRRRVQDPEFQAGLAALREPSHVDYAGVAEAKFGVLRRLFAHFSREHLAEDTARAVDFRRWCRERGDRLLAFATYEALRGHFADQGESRDWRDWPEEYRNSRSAAVRQFRNRYPAAVAFAMYLQWLAWQQLDAAQQTAREAGMAVGLYLDLALGTVPDGAETWMDPDLFVDGMSIGAPPDPLALKGQDWGLAPISPAALAEAGMAPLRRLLDSNMRHCGAVRLDHVMSLMRLWWVPAGHEPTDGLYVANPMQDMLAVLTLESQRNQCLVIGEDLGTVAPQVRQAMRERGIYSYAVLYFEKDEQEQFRRPADFPAECLLTVATHDLPTLAAYWDDSDIDLRRRLGLFPSEGVAAELAAERAWDRGALLYALQREGLLPPGMSTDPASVPEMSRPLASAVEAYLARSGARLVMIQPEDWLLMHEAVNVPGTDEENPNWRRRLDLPWPEMLVRSEVAESCRRINQERAGRSRPGETDSAE